LVAHGHDATKLPDYSLDLIRLYYRKEQERQAKAEAALDLRFARAVRIAVGSLFGKQNGPNARAWRQFEGSLTAIITDQQQDQKKNVMGIAQLVKRLGGSIG
jgi:hypothetical protein